MTQQIAAQRLAIVDGRGMERIVLGLDESEDDAPHIRLFRRDGRPAASLQTDAEGRVMLALLDADGGWRLQVRVQADGTPDVSLFDPDHEEPRLSLVVEPDLQDQDGNVFSGRAEVRLMTPDGEAHAQLFVTNDGSGDLSLLNSEGGGWSYGPPTGSPGEVTQGPPYEQ